MESITADPSRFLCVRMNSSRSIGIARFQTSSHDRFLNWVLVRRRSLGLFLILKRHVTSASRLSLPSLCAPLRYVYRTLLCRRIQRVRRCGSVQNSQPFFLWHQYLLMSSSLGIPACSNSMSKLTFLEMLYAKCMNIPCIYPIAYEKPSALWNAVLSVVKRFWMSCGKIPKALSSNKFRFPKSILKCFIKMCYYPYYSGSN